VEVVRTKQDAICSILQFRLHADIGPAEQDQSPVPFKGKALSYGVSDGAGQPHCALRPVIAFFYPDTAAILL